MQYEGRGMPSASSVERWALEDSQFAEDITRTRKALAAKRAEETISIADEDPQLTPQGTVDNGAERHRVTRINARQWLAEKGDPKTYGSQQNIDVQTHTQINMTVLLQEAKGRTVEGVILPASSSSPIESSPAPLPDCSDLFE